MAECFALRFNLDECCGVHSSDQIRAISGMFGLNESYVRSSAETYEQLLKAYISKLDKELLRRVQSKYQKKQIVFFGDSITSDKLSYARMIAGVLPKVSNCAISSITSANVLRNLEEDLSKVIPHIAVIFIGTNDACEKLGKTVVSVEEYGKNLSAVLRALHNCEHRILFLLPGGRQYSDGVKIAFNQKLNSLAGLFQCEILDLSFLSGSAENFEEDGVHLSVQAQFQVAQKLLKMFDADF